MYFYKLHLFLHMSYTQRCVRFSLNIFMTLDMLEKKLKISLQLFKLKTGKKCSNLLQENCRFIHTTFISLTKLNLFPKWKFRFYWRKFKNSIHVFSKLINVVTNNIWESSCEKVNSVNATQLKSTVEIRRNFQQTTKEKYMEDIETEKLDTKNSH